MESVDALVDDLFRREFGRIVAALTGIFGPKHLSRAEDVVQDVLCRALEVWKFRGIPDNPSAWLMSAAKNRVIDLLRRDQTARAFASMFIESNTRPGFESADQETEALFDPERIDDDQLRMMFSCCDPKIPEEAQIALMLNILCGFSVGEIAAAFFASRAAIEKRLARAKKVLAESPDLFNLEEDDISRRLPAVHRALYLLFNEGYHGANPKMTIRADVCREAYHLAEFLLKHRTGAEAETYGLSALMLFLMARLPSRIDSNGNLLSLEHQDRSSWSKELIVKGHEYLEESARGSTFSEYHIEAAIAAIHSVAARFEDTQWGAIVELYDELIELRPTAVVALNRAIAIGQRDGAQRGLDVLSGIDAADKLAAYPFYWAALAEFELRLDRRSDAAAHFTKAHLFARNDAERDYFAARILACQ